MIKVGSKVKVHRRNSPFELIMKMWEEYDDLEEEPIEDIFSSLFVYDQVGEVIDVESADNILVNYGKNGCWCLKSSMLEEVQC